MGQWEELLEYCDSNLVLMFKTKPVKESKRANDEDVDANGNGLNFSPLCNSFCFTKKKECDHKKKKVQINNVGEYVQFPSKWYHQGYFNDVWERLLSKHNYLQGQVLHRRVHYQRAHPLKIKSLKDSWLLKQ
jgi:hypothetical protein